jgi:hypothetical protein
MLLYINILIASDAGGNGIPKIFYITGVIAKRDLYTKASTEMCES